jgi:hypothetical protein
VVRRFVRRDIIGFIDYRFLSHMSRTITNRSFSILWEPRFSQLIGVETPSLFWQNVSSGTDKLLVQTVETARGDAVRRPDN